MRVGKGKETSDMMQSENLKCPADMLAIVVENEHCEGERVGCHIGDTGRNEAEGCSSSGLCCWVGRNVLRQA